MERINNFQEFRTNYGRLYPMLVKWAASRIADDGAFWLSQAKSGLLATENNISYCESRLGG